MKRAAAEARGRKAERRAAWRAEFETLDLGSYDEACMRSAQHIGKLCWTVLLIQPHRSFPVHQHPDIEVEFVLRGALYENRLLSQPNAPLAGAQACPLRLRARVVSVPL